MALDSSILCDFLEIVYYSGNFLEVLTEAGHTIYTITMHSHNIDIYTLGFPVAQTVKNLPAMQETLV